MAITKISGELLESNLIRNQDLAFNSNLLYVDVSNGRIGIGTDEATSALQIYAADTGEGTAKAGGQAARRRNVADAEFRPATHRCEDVHGSDQGGESTDG